jgi:tRNA-specific 2-thiouridylase
MKRIVVGLSGGVDSSFAAYLKLKEGYDVIGVTLNLYGENDFFNAEKAAEFLGIKWYVADYRKEFQNSVISYFIKTYVDGKTPNPCAYCNRFAKFPYLYNEMLKNNAEFIVTGHYARITSIDGENFISVPKDKKKDQSYYLALLDKEILRYVEFPLSNYLKEEIRVIAKDINLPAAKIKDSQEICFLQGRDYREFLISTLKKEKYRPGNFILNGTVLGEHRGLPFYTIGQRKGLGLNYHKALYVAHVDTINNNIILKEGEPSLCRSISLYDCNFFYESTKLEDVSVVLRYRMKKAKATLERLPFLKAHILFDKPETSGTPGQIAAIYKGDKLIGGGFIGEVV